MTGPTNRYVNLRIIRGTVNIFLTFWQNDLLQWYIDSEHADAKLKTISDRVMVTNFAAIHTSSLVRLVNTPIY